MNSFRSWIQGGRPAEPLLRTKKPVLSAPSDVPAEENIAEAVKREAVRQANHRDGDRHRFEDESIELTHGRACQVVRIVNLSGGGAMIEGVDGLKLWDRVFLRLGEFGQVEAAVRWIRGNRVGLEFAHETQVIGKREDTERLLRAVIARSFPDVVAKAAQDTTAGVDHSPSASSNLEEPVEDSREEIARDYRHPLIWSGQIHYNHETIAVRLRNISKGGALIECAETLAVGGELLLELEGAGSVFATINWARGDMAGLKFHEAFDMQQLAAVRPQVAAPRWVMPDYLRDGAGSSSPWAKQWGRSDLNSLHDKLHRRGRP